MGRSPAPRCSRSTLGVPPQPSPGEPWGSTGWGRKGSGLSDVGLSAAQMQPQRLCEEGDGAPLAGGETGVLPLIPEPETVLPEGKERQPLTILQLTIPFRGSPAAPPQRRGVQPPGATSRGCRTGSASPRARRKQSQSLEERSLPQLPGNVPTRPPGSFSFRTGSV